LDLISRFTSASTEAREEVISARGLKSDIIEAWKRRKKGAGCSRAGTTAPPPAHHGREVRRALEAALPLPSSSTTTYSTGPAVPLLLPHHYLTTLLSVLPAQQHKASTAPALRLLERYYRLPVHNNRLRPM